MDQTDFSTNAKSIEVVSGELHLRLSIGTGQLTLNQITDSAGGVQYLTQMSSLFDLAASALDSTEFDYKWHITDYNQSSELGEARINGRIASHPIFFTLTVSPGPNKSEIELRLTLKNKGGAPLHLRASFPKIETLITERDNRPLEAAIPQEAGGVASFSQEVNLGMGADPEIGLPVAMNLMEVVSLHDPLTGAGVYFLDGEGDLRHDLAPLQFTLRNSSVTGHWVTDLPPNSDQSTPMLIIGVHHAGNWHTAVDRFNARHAGQSVPNVDIPAWFRDQGAIYSFSGFGGGSIYMAYPHESLDTRIESFHQLPRLLDEAKSLGTNILYLWDYWEGAPEGSRPAYWNKGDYKPRQDLGGADALRQGIQALHGQGGRVVFYLEWFIAFHHSEIGKAYGEHWAARRHNGDPHDHYRQNYSLPASGAWRDHLINVAVRLVREYDIDGIYLDSMGWQMNLPAVTRAGNKRYTSKEFSVEALRFVEHLRAAIREIKPDAVVFGENTGGSLPHLWDGGLSADFVWLAEQNQRKLLASPARYGVPNLNLYSNGYTRNETHQIFAGGHSLALANAHLPDAEYIRRLVHVRQRYKDALIYGKQAYQPKTGNDKVAAYYYAGNEHEVITVVNIADEAFCGTLALKPETPVNGWEVVWGDSQIEATPKGLLVKVAAKQLLILATHPPRSEGARRADGSPGD